MLPKNWDFHEISTFRENSREGFKKLLRCLRSVLECLRVSRNDFRISIRSRKNADFFQFFQHVDHDFGWFHAIVQCNKLHGKCRDTSEVNYNQECNRRKALRVIPRGKQRLTVYRAHQVWRWRRYPGHRQEFDVTALPAIHQRPRQNETERHSSSSRSRRGLGFRHCPWRELGLRRPLARAWPQDQWLHTWRSMQSNDHRSNMECRCIGRSRRSWRGLGFRRRPRRELGWGRHTTLCSHASTPHRMWMHLHAIWPDPAQAQLKRAHHFWSAVSTPLILFCTTHLDCRTANQTWCAR